MLKQFTKKFTEKEFKYLIINNRYYLENKELTKLDNPYTLGLYLGKERNNKFYPSLALLELISKHSKEKIFVDNKREWLFLCGREIYIDKKIKIQGRGTDIKLVQNQKDENLGLGKIGNKKVKNLVNRGDFLKREN